MSDDNDKIVKKDDEEKLNRKVTVTIKKKDDDWTYNANIVTIVQEVDQNQKETSEDSK